MNVKLEILQKSDEGQFIKDNQYAFKYGAEQYFNDQEMSEQFEEEGEIISKNTIFSSIHRKGSIAYRILLDEKPVGGIIINLNRNVGDLEIFFVNPDVHSKGIGQETWKLVEKLHSNIKIWETVTPTFEKRNIHFYVNKLKFHIVEYYNEYYHDKDCPEDMLEMYKFQKNIA